MDIKIGLIGAEGKLGKAIQALYPVIPISRTTSRKNLACDVLIDVSSPDALLENLSAKKPIVIGTTGHKDFSLIEKAAKELPIFYSANFSLGIALMRKMIEQIKENFPSEVELIETHHTQKKDTPSGTALLLAKSLPHAKIHSIRQGDLMGEHTLIFKQEEETLTLSHSVQSRKVFARGALAAAKFLIHQPPGLYTMDNLFLKKI
jgi:4-hydroxy-tetrahydrodipicolinate reductase